MNAQVGTLIFLRLFSLQTCSNRTNSASCLFCLAFILLPYPPFVTFVQFLLHLIPQFAFIYIDCIPCDHFLSRLSQLCLYSYCSVLVSSLFALYFCSYRVLLIRRHLLNFTSYKATKLTSTIGSVQAMCCC